MMASKQPAAAALGSDDEGQDYDPVYNYGSASDYEEDKYQHTQAAHSTTAPSSKTAPPLSPTQQHNYGYSDDDSEDDYYNQQQQQHNQHVRQVVSPSSVALPTSPVSSRGGPGAGGYDSYNDRRDSYPTPTSHVAPVDTSATTPVAGTTSAAPIPSSRNSWEENDSDDDEPYPADAYDYGQEDESSSGDEYEERPSSSQVLKQQEQPQAFHGYSDHDDSENEFEERPRSHLEHHQQQRQSQQPAAAAQGNNYAADSSHSEDEYEERPRSHIQQQQSQPPSSNHYHAGSQFEDEFEERPRSHQQQQQFHGYNDHHAANSQSEDEYEERPRSHVQQRQSTQSNHAHTEIAHVAQKEQEAKNPYNYDSDYSRSSSEDHRQSAPISAPVAAVAPVHHQEEKQHNGRYSTESFDRRSSYEEEKVEPTVTLAAPVHYGSDSDSDDDYKPALASPVAHQQQPKEAFYGDFGEEPVPHNMFQSSALDPRASVNSAKSFSSHTKHHSFGYDERPAEHDVPSESESGSSSESDEPEKKNKLKELSSTLMSAAAAAPESPPTTQAPPPIPNKSRPTSTFSLASHNSLASPRSPTFARSMGSPVAERWEQPAATRAPDSPVVSAASAPVIAAAAAAAVAAAATAAVVASPPTSAPAPIPVPTSPAAPVSPPSPVKDTPLAVDTVSQKSASSASSLDARQKNSGYDSDTSGTSIDLHSPTYKSQSSKMTPPSVFTRTFSSSSSGGTKDTKANQGPVSPERTRPISYATVFSDADMNDVNLMDEPLATEQRASVVVPRTPVTPSAFGFASGFFGGAAARSQPTPPPPSSSQPQQAPLPATPVQATPSTPVAPTPPPKANDTRSRSTSISAFASSIGAFARGFSSQSQPPVPPMPSRTPSQISQRTSNAPAPSTFAAFGQQQQQQQQQDPRNSSANRSMTSARASTISNATNDSNMDMLLARLEAQNELLAQESKRRVTTESDMDRALNHAKEEAAPGDDVDWGRFCCTSPICSR